MRPYTRKTKCDHIFPSAAALAVTCDHISPEAPRAQLCAWGRARNYLARGICVRSRTGRTHPHICPLRSTQKQTHLRSRCSEWLLCSHMRFAPRRYSSSRPGAFVSLHSRCFERNSSQKRSYPPANFAEWRVKQMIGTLAQVYRRALRIESVNRRRKVGHDRAACAWRRALRPWRHDHEALNQRAGKRSRLQRRLEFAQAPSAMIVRLEQRERRQRVDD